MKTLILLTFLIFVTYTYADLDPRFYIGNDTTFKKAIEKNKITVDQWLGNIQRDGVDFLCLGESHKDNYRTYIAEQIIAKLKIDKLFLEADDNIAIEFLKKIDAGEERVEHLCAADMAKIVRSSRLNNSEIKIYGVDENDSQETETRNINTRLGENVASRDGFIAQNIYQKLDENELSIALYGSSHCAQNDIGLGRTTFWYLLGPVFKEKNMNAKSVRFIPSGDYSQFDLHMLLLGQKAPFVIPDTSKVDPKVFGHRWDLMENFSNYDVIVYF